MRFDKLIQGGRVVTPEGTQRADIGIVGEKIAAVGPGLGKEQPGAQVIDARGHYVLSGAIDAHVHLDLPVKGMVTSDDYRSGTRAAARGGVTTVIDFATAYGEETLQQAVDHWHRRAEGKALVDYSFHASITRWDRQKKEIKKLIGQGIPTFKEYMIYESEGWQSDDGVLFETLETMKKHGAMLLVHAESSSVLDRLTRRYHKPEWMKQYGAGLAAMSRPNFIEAEAVQRAVKWCEVTGGRLYIVHLSTGEGAEILKEAQARGVPVLGETCPQYLVLDKSVLFGSDGHLFATAPQLKKPKDNRRLWRGLRDGEIAVVATDTCTFTRKQKNRWKGDWTRIPGGLPGLETLLPILYTHGVLKKRLSLEEMCRKLSTNPARVMGLYPRKGVIQPGADADLVIIHPTKRLRVDPATMETNADWSPYEGWELAGFARTTLSRGEVIVDDYKVVGREGRGRWLPRRLSPKGTL